MNLTKIPINPKDNSALVKWFTVSSDSIQNYHCALLPIEVSRFHDFETHVCVFRLEWDPARATQYSRSLSSFWLSSSGKKRQSNNRKDKRAV